VQSWPDLRQCCGNDVEELKSTAKVVTELHIFVLNDVMVLDVILLRFKRMAFGPYATNTDTSFEGTGDWSHWVLIF
jgi:hypothetical protein